MKSFMSWSGNKKKYKNIIIPMCPKSYNTYIEPFLGSGSIFLAMRPAKWIINDLNTDLINTWLAVRNSPTRMINQIKQIGDIFVTMSVDEKMAFCKQIAKDLNTLPHGLKRVVYFTLLKFCSFMGVIMRKGSFVFPGLDHFHIKFPGKYPWYFREEYFQNLRVISKYLKTGDIFNRDYKDILKMAKKGDFVFLDPPYIEDHDYGFNYNRGEILNEGFINGLYKEVQKLDKRCVNWLMTQADTPFIRKTFQKYTISEMRVYRAARKDYATELIIRNNQ
jgi:DNA adenine methylase